MAGDSGLTYSNPNLTIGYGSLYIGTSLATAGKPYIGGLNGISYPSADTNCIGCSIEETTTATMSIQSFVVNVQGCLDNLAWIWAFEIDQRDRQGNEFDRRLVRSVIFGLEPLYCLMMLLREIGRHRTAEQSYMDEGVALLTIAKDSVRLFEKRPAADKRRLLNFVLSNSTWRDGELTATFRQPFNIIAEMSNGPPDEDGDGGPDPAPRSGWWPRQDSNLQPDRYERWEKGCAL
ncbi:hypothetical protein AOQ71_04570 [Bradyrhizobium manausense]|uniref:Uncharacterized protein n=1 Tax=Bradyrhizobium manausense TaxID=989370 RepID=A0A0R3E3N5_9BRAD|nr:hypothetical protein AOQ71_04570 [Bradyrhizobium manausense]